MKNILYNVRTQVFLVVLGVAVIVIGVHFFLFHPILYDILLENELDQIQSAAQATAQTLDLELNLGIESLESVAAIDGFDELDLEVIDRSLATFDAVNPFFLYTWAMDSNGKVLSAPARPDRLGEDRSRRDYFIRPTPQQPTHFQNVQISTRGRFSLAVGTAILNKEGKKVGVLAGSLGLMDRNPRMYTAVLNAPFPDKYSIFLVSSNDILLAHSDKKLPQPSPEGLDLLGNQPFKDHLETDNNTKIVSFNGHTYILAMSTVPLTGWKVVVQVPETITAQNVDKIIHGLTILFGLLLLIVLFISLFFANRFSLSLSKLTAALNSFRVSGTADFVEVKKNDELSDAVKAFNNMLMERQEIESRLRNSEKRFRALVDQASDAFFLYDPEGNILDVNQRACDTLGYSRKELLSMSFADIDAAAVGQETSENLWKTIEPDAPITVEGLHRRKDGSTFPVEARIGLLSVNGDNNILALVRDISGRRKSEEKLRQAQKMEAIGNLAGGIAHDFNNILTAIFGNIELVMMQADLSDNVRDKLMRIKQSSQRAKDLVDQILAFSRKTEQEKQPLRVDVVIKEAIKLLRSSIPTTIAINENITSGVKMLADPTEVHQIIMNLCTNAYQSMLEAGGTLEVTLKEVEITHDDIVMGLELNPGRFLRLEVSDTGCGMSVDIMDKIFEPYFTTKGSGKGTGLGLAVVHGIVKNYGGLISVYSEPDMGTTFRIYLPALDSEFKTDSTPLPAEVMEGGTEHIVYIDDEEQNVTVIKEMLSSQGYRVDIYTNVVQAWQEIQRQPEKFDLVITDMTMPFMTGVQLAKNVMEIRSDLPVILCTGFSEYISREKSKNLGIKGFINKPVSMADLLKTVREVLDESGTSP